MIDRKKLRIKNKNQFVFYVLHQQNLIWTYINH